MADAPAARIATGDHEDQFVDLWLPDAGDEHAHGTIVLIHGGYWRQMYDLTGLGPLASHLTDRGWIVLNVEYRRVNGQEAVWEQMSSDVLAAAALAEARPVIAVGHSAGGHLALWTGTDPGLVDAIVALAPLADLRAADRRNLSNGAVVDLLGGHHDEVPHRYDEASPIERVPLGVPQLVVHGDADESVPQQLSIDYVQAAVDAGDDVVLHAPAGVDHMQVIDPEDWTWEIIDAHLDTWAATLPQR